MSGMSPVRNQCWDERGAWEENGNSCLNEVNCPNKQTGLRCW